MNIVNQLTLRHLKQNKRRTLVTIIGVIISVAMVMAVATLAISFTDLMKRQSISDEGEWHVLYKDVDKEQFEAIQQDEATKEVIISKDFGYAHLEDSQNENKPYLFIKAYNALGFEKFPIELSTGRLPKTPDEIVISEAIATNAKVDYGIGDTLTLDIGDRFLLEDMDTPLDQTYSLHTNSDEQSEIQLGETLEINNTVTYTIVGTIRRPTWEPTWSPGYTLITYIDEDFLQNNHTVNASVIVNKIKGSLFSDAEAFAEENGIEFMRTNTSLLRYYGAIGNDSLRVTLYSLSTIIMIIIMIGSVSLIYNAFAISVSERSRHLGMLSSVGATNRQKKKSVFFEGAVIGLISIPIGIFSGLAGIGITFYFINKMIQGALGVTEELQVTVSVYSLAAACVVSIATIFISTYLPAKRASKISAIDAIRQTEDVKLTGKAVKTSKIVRKIFGIEAEIGLKNLKRNKRRYQATVFSLVISIVLFLSVSFFTSNLKKSLSLSQDGANYDISIQMDNDQLAKTIANLEGVTESSVLKQTYSLSSIHQDAISDELKKLIEEGSLLLPNGKFTYDIVIHSLSDERLKAYAKAVGADYEQLTNLDKPSAILIDTIPYQDQNTSKFVETKVIHTKVQETLDLHYVDEETEEETLLSRVEIAALTDQFPMGIRPNWITNLDIIVSENVLKQLASKNKKASIHTQMLLKSDDPMATQTALEEMKDSNLTVYNAYQSRQQDEQLIVLMSVFTYGFILLITAISIANIFNTISTSISLRKREFAMLKSVGMTPKGFNKMINYESIFYGIKSLLYGLPISLIGMLLIHRSLMNSFDYKFEPPWIHMLYVIVAVFIIVGAAMLYSSNKVKKENIIDALKQENI